MRWGNSRSIASWMRARVKELRLISSRLVWGDSVRSGMNPAQIASRRLTVGDVATMKHEDGQFLGFRSRSAHSGCSHAIGFDPLDLFGDTLQILRVVVQAVDDDQILGPAGDHELSVPQQPEIAGVQPSVGRAHFGRSLLVPVIALCHVVAAHLHMSQHALFERYPVIVDDSSS